MLFKPVQLGREALDKDVLIADRKSCKRFGPCGVGEKALYLSSFYRSCRYYLPYGGITRVFKRADWMEEAADYSTEMRCHRHPFHRGIPAREGVEF